VEGVLLIAHGTSAPGAEAIVEALADMLRARLPGCPLQVAYLCSADAGIEAGLGRLVGLGVTHVKVAPCFLFDGVHVREGVPAAIAAFRERFPQVMVSLGRSLGADARIADVLAERIAEI